MRNSFYILLVCFLAFISCQKEEHEPAQPKIRENSKGSFVESITQNSVVFQFELTSGGSPEAGVYLASDSAMLANPQATGSFTKATYDEKNKSYVVEVAGLVPYTTYWYTVEVRDSDITTYSKISSFTTKGFHIKWQDGFSKKIKLVEPLYRDLILLGENVDTEISNYEVKYGDMQCVLWKIAALEAVPDIFQYYVQVPVNAPVGVKKFSVYFKGIKIFEDDLEVEKGNVYDIIKVAQHPDGVADRAYFKYNNKLYTIFLNSDTYHMNVWDPLTNQWERKAVPSEVKLRKGANGQEINGKIYFPPEMYYGGYVDGRFVPRQERLYSYDPVNDVWEGYPLHSTFSLNDSVHPYDTFVYQDKLYCFVQELRYPEGSIVNEGKSLLKVFNPVDKSWKVVMELNQEDVWGYRAVVIKGKIYVLESRPLRQYSATTDLKYVLYELDLALKTWTKKSAPVFNSLEKGALEPALFEYKERMYVYGGMRSIGYFGYGTSDLYEFSPELNKWTQLFISPNNNYIPCQEHFAYVLNGQVYFGLGLTYTSNPSSDIWKLDLE